MSNLLRCVLALSAVYVLSGCNAPKSHLNKFNQSFETADFEQAREFATDRKAQARAGGLD